MSEPAILPPAKDSPGPPLGVQAFGLTDRGRVRPANEDQFLVAELTKTMKVCYASLPQPTTQYADERAHLFIVADGIGGHKAGEEASALAVETIEAFALNTLKWFFHLKADEQNVLHEFQRALQQADARVCREAARNPEFAGMGTTVTMAYTLDSRLFLAHVGDSRCYLFRAGHLHRLTRDHTLVDEMVRRGLIEADKAAHHRLRHIVTNVIGGHEPGVDVECHRLDLEPSDMLLLCSDGLTRMAPDDRITAILQTTSDPRTACEQLVCLANENGGKDNITVIVARFEPITH